QRLSVQMLVAARDDVEQAVAIARSWGFEPARVTAANANLAPGDGRKSYNLLPPSQYKPRGQAMKRLSAAAALAVVALIAVAVYLPLQQRKAELAAAQQKLDKVRVVAERASKMKKQVDDLVARNSFVVDEKRQIPAAVEILDVVSRALPDNTWLLQLVYRDGSLRLSGYSQEPSALIRLLEKTELLKEVRFSSPVTMDPRLGRERFNIIASVPDKEVS
ncbi:MAG TPA: PilN domain-containing protein, partial [Kiloniellaceae bacterium]|nr:PilN domain-containing protein [Kiloniellaceae bacterium]